MMPTPSSSAPPQLARPSHLHHDAIAQGGVAVHLLDVGVDLAQIQRLDLVVDGLEVAEGLMR